MKHFLKINLLIILLLLSACSSKTYDTGSTGLTINDLFSNESFERRMDSYYENTYKAIFVCNDNYYKLCVNMNDAEYSKLENISSYDYDTAEVKKKEILLNCKDYEIIDISSSIPTNEELSQYVGLSIADIESKGFEITGNTIGEEGLIVYLSGSTYEMKVSFVDITSDIDLDDYSLNDIRQFIVAKAEFEFFTFDFLDN